MRLTLAKKREVYQFEILDAICRAAPRERFEVAEFVCVRGDDEFAASIVWHVVGLAKPIEPLGSLDAQTRFERSAG